MKLALATMLVFAAQAAPSAAGTFVRGEPALPPSKSAPAAAGFHKRLAPGSVLATRHLAPLERHEQDRLARGHDGDEKRTLVGISRALGSRLDAASLNWSPVAGGLVAHASVSSPEARSMRLSLRARELPAGTELRFAGDDSIQPALPPVSGAAVVDATRQDGVWWSPVTAGTAQAVEIFIPTGADPARVRLSFEAASHLSTGASNLFKVSAKAAGGCHEDVACVAPSNPALARAARSVAKLVFTENGATFTCTGTLINDADQASQAPYVYTAAHCIDSQAAAASLNTFWFFEAPACASKAAGTFKQLAGGATLLHANPQTDAALVRLSDRAPDGAWFSGWDAAALGAGASVVGIHHPQGEVKKVAMGQTLAATPSSGGGSYATASWLAGTTEPGSSGSGLFTLAGGEYVLRGGLKGGSASCTSSGRTDDPSNRDYYSRLDLEAASLRTWLAAGPAPLEDYTDLWFDPAQPGWGVGVVQHASNRVFVTWYAYDDAGRPTWFVMPDGAWKTAYALEGTIYRTLGTGWSQDWQAARHTAAPSGSARLEFGHDGRATARFTIDGVTVVKNLSRQGF